SAAQREAQLKAAYLFNFMKFVEWPPDAVNGGLTVCFTGGDGVYHSLIGNIENKKVGNRAMTVRQAKLADDLRGCNALFIEARFLSEARSLLASGKLSMLTVSDAKDFIHSGGIIELYTDNNRLRFNVNLDNADKAGLRISSSLLQLAATVEKGNGK